MYCITKFYFVHKIRTLNLKGVYSSICLKWFKYCLTIIHIVHMYDSIECIGAINWSFISLLSNLVVFPLVVKWHTYTHYRCIWLMNIITIQSSDVIHHLNMPASYIHLPVVSIYIHLCWIRLQVLIVVSISLFSSHRDFQTCYTLLFLVEKHF